MRHAKHRRRPGWTSSIGSTGTSSRGRGWRPREDGGPRGRGERLGLAIRLAVVMTDARRGLTMRELAMRYRLPLRLVYRYIAALEMGGVPLVVDGNRYRILPGWIDRIARTP